MTIWKKVGSKAKKVYTLVFLLRDHQVLLGLKKYGFGKDKWNGFGGKVEPGEKILDAAVRETQEECGLSVKSEDLSPVGIIHFEFVNNPVLMEVHVFKSDKFDGEVTESTEMLPQWFPTNQVPHDKMWADDEVWYPLLLEGTKFRGYFLFQDFTTYLNYVLVDFDKPDVVLKSFNLDQIQL